MNSGTTYERSVKPRDNIYVVKHGLKIPCMAESYDAFVLKMHENEAAFCRSLADAACCSG